MPLRPDGIYVDADRWVWHPCVNRELFGCPWLTERPGEQCFSCSLTRTRPSDADLKGLSQFPLAEAAKRRLVVELDALGLPIVTRDDDPDHGLAFDLLSSVAENVTIGHVDGVITLDLAEGDDAYRERMRVEMAEPYRTLLGHFRHEIGHYYEALLVDDDEPTSACASCSATRPPTTSRLSTGTTPRVRREGWEQNYISSYATMHPFEDFAETFAHVMHITRHRRHRAGTRALDGRPVRVLLVPRPRHRGVGADEHRAQPDQPQHGRRRPLPLRAGAGRARQARPRRRDRP